MATHPSAIAARAGAAPSAAPIDTDERLHSLDIVRGIALFFMILVHFHQRLRVTADVPNDGSLRWLVDEALGWGIWIFVEQKAWGTFALLFGTGFALFLRRLEGRGAPVVPIFLRRMATLALIGLFVSRVLGFDILLEYASWGAVLLVVRHWSTRALLALAVASAMARPVAMLALALSAHLAGATPARPGAWWILLPGTSFVLFILGLLAVRVRVPDEPLAHERLIRRWMLGGLACWALSWLVLGRLPLDLPIRGTEWPIRSVLGLVNEQWLCLFYAGGALLLLARRPALQPRLAWLGVVGRMALTNYVLQAAVVWYLFAPLAIRVRPVTYVSMTLLLFGIELILSRQWLARFRFGPLEWLWRMASYWRWQPLRRGEAVRVAPA